MKVKIEEKDVAFLLLLLENLCMSRMSNQDKTKLKNLQKRLLMALFNEKT